MEPKFCMAKHNTASSTFVDGASNHTPLGVGPSTYSCCLSASPAPMQAGSSFCKRSAAVGSAVKPSTKAFLNKSRKQNPEHNIV